MHATVNAYKGFLVIELLANKSIKDEVVSTIDTPGVMGQVIMNTEANLGVSQEALDLLSNMRKCGGSFSEVDWFSVDGGGHAFGWMGGTKALFNASETEVSRTFSIGAHVVIPNNVPQGAKDAIDG